MAIDQVSCQIVLYHLIDPVTQRVVTCENQSKVTKRTFQINNFTIPRLNLLRTPKINRILSYEASPIRPFGPTNKNSKIILQLNKVKNELSNHRNFCCGEMPGFTIQYTGCSG